MIDEKIVRHSEESALPPQLYEAHEMLWSNDIFGAKEVFQETDTPLKR
jgi:hypothetical protein